MNSFFNTYDKYKWKQRVPELSAILEVLFCTISPSIVCHVEIRLYCLHTLPNQVFLHDMFQHCSCCCFCDWSWGEEIQQEVGLCIPLSHKALITGVSSISSIPAKHVTSCCPPHCERCSTQTQHLFGTGLYTIHDSLQ